MKWLVIAVPVAGLLIFGGLYALDEYEKAQRKAAMKPLSEADRKRLDEALEQAQARVEAYFREWAAALETAAAAPASSPACAAVKAFEVRRCPPAALKTLLPRGHTSWKSDAELIAELRAKREGKFRPGELETQLEKLKTLPYKQNEAVVITTRDDPPQLGSSTFKAAVVEGTAVMIIGEPRRAACAFPISARNQALVNAPIGERDLALHKDLENRLFMAIEAGLR